jgi:hypothetical protein
VSVAGGDTAFTQLVQHGGVVDTQVFADPRQGPAKVVEMDGLVDLVGGEAEAAHRHAVPTEDVAGGSPFDAEPVTEFVHRRAGLVVGDQLLDLIGAELPGAAGSLRLIDAGSGVSRLDSFLPSSPRVLTWSFVFE